MTTQADLFDITKRYHGGNEHSKKANEIAHKYKIGARQRILEELGNTSWHGELGLSCEEIEDATGLSHQSCSARCSELRREGKIKIVGERKTRSGAMAAVYQAI